jgi:hypothetical protein
MFDHVVLEPDQKDLFMLIVEASRNVEKNERRKFLVVQSKDGDSLLHPGIPREKSEIYYGDVEILANAGLLNLGFGSGGSPVFDVNPIGYQYYRYLKEAIGEPLERVENSILSFLKSEPLINKYKNAFEKWTQAQDLLWSADSQQQLTTIGHLCRESMLEFADALICELNLQTKYSDKSKIVARLKGVFSEKKKVLPSTIHPLLEALIFYWGCVSDIVQRQEHGASKEGEGLVWEDARRVVFNTLTVMYEIDNAI